MGWPDGSRGPGSRSQGSSRGSYAPPGRTRRSSTGRRLAGAWSKQKGRYPKWRAPKLEACSPSRETSTGERGVRKRTRLVRRRAGGKGRCESYLACGLSYFLVGFVGPHKEAEEIKQELRTFLQRELKLTLSEEKTLITHAKTEAAKFLGYEVLAIQDDSKRPIHEMGIDRRSHNGHIGLSVPRKIIEGKCHNYMRNGKAIHRPELLYLSDYDIVMVYQSQYRGIANYYQLAYNMCSLAKLKRCMEISLLKTLAAKHKMSVKKIAEKYKATLTVRDKEYKVFQVKVPREGKEPLVATWGGIPLVWDINATLNEQPPKIYTGYRTELVQRLLASICEICGSTREVEVHHIRAMKDLHEYPGHEKPLWVRRMIAMRRKTMPVCQKCHEDIHAGRPLRQQPIALTEVKAMQKAKTQILESRVH